MSATKDAVNSSTLGFSTLFRITLQIHWVFDYQAREMVPILKFEVETTTKCIELKVRFHPIVSGWANYV